MMIVSAKVPALCLYFDVLVYLGCFWGLTGCISPSEQQHVGEVERGLNIATSCHPDQRKLQMQT